MLPSGISQLIEHRQHRAAFSPLQPLTRLRHPARVLERTLIRLVSSAAFAQALITFAHRPALFITLKQLALPDFDAGLLADLSSLAHETLTIFCSSSILDSLRNGVGPSATRPGRGAGRALDTSGNA